MKVYRIYDSCWSTNLWVICPAQNRELDQFIRRKFGIDEKTHDGGFLGRFVEITGDNNDEVGVVIALRQWTGDSRDYATLSHELLHAVSFFLRNRDIKLSSKTEETYCYFLDSLMRRCIEKLRGAR